MIDYRILHTMDELEQVVDLQLDVWRMNPRNTVPAALMHVFTANRGLVMGAYEGEKMVGLLVSLPANDGQEWILWSHMTGVHPDYQNRRIGVELKLRQRQWALENGYQTIRWTADPLIPGNANFNLGLLGRDACLYINTYHVNFYGDMDDDINRGMPSDRIEATWRIGQPSLHAPVSAQIVSLLAASDAGHPAISDKCGQWDEPEYRVDLPRHYESLKTTDKPTLLAWRLAVRDVLQAGFANGYAAVGFIHDNTGRAYILKRLGEFA